jgi:hypothetical protein
MSASRDARGELPCRVRKSERRRWTSSRAIIAESYANAGDIWAHTLGKARARLQLGDQRVPVKLSIISPVPPLETWATMAVRR